MRASFNRSFLVVVAAFSASALVACGGDSGSTTDSNSSGGGNAGAAGASAAGAAGSTAAGAAGAGVAGAAGTAAAGAAGSATAGAAGSATAGAAGAGDAGAAGAGDAGAAGAGDAGAAGAGDAGAAGAGDAGAAGAGDAGAAGAGDAGAAGAAGATGTACKTNDPAACGDGKYCKPDVAACGATGVCEDRPTVCPVGCSKQGACGCDGNVYCNSCAAAAAGVGVSPDGSACNADVACGSNADCGDAQYCLFDAAQSCGAGGKGVCRPLPTVCSKEIAPVCGCDGKDYTNSCLAAIAGTSVASDGSCVKGTACKTNTDCGSAQWCQLGDACGGPGECVDKPLLCTKQLAPVCGCDGKVYNNSCFAQQAGATVDTRPSGSDACAATATTCGGKTGKVCADNEFCDYPDGTMCGAADQTGTCTARPSLCPLIKAPVCGCDGKTYGNSCLAQQAGVDVSASGACGTTVQSCGPNLKACPTDQFCKFESIDDACGYQTLGTCTAKPALCGKCSVLATQVCGCDGKMYCNECTANAAGTALAPASVCAGTTPTVCTNNKGCALTEFCDFTDADVCGKQGTGICAARPKKCEPICNIKGICGCDGKIYCSECDAESAGVSVAPSNYCNALPVQ